MLFRLSAVTYYNDWCFVFTFNFYAMRTKKNTKPTLLEIINYWHDQKKKNIGKFDVEHYMRVCQAKAYQVRFDEHNKMLRL